MKKTLAILLSVCMLLSLSVTMASAENASGYKFNVTFDDSTWGEDNWTVEKGESAVVVEGPYTKTPVTCLYENVMPIPEGPVGDPNRTYTIGVSIPHSLNIWYSGEIDTAMIEAAKHENVELVVLSANSDATQQANDIDSFVARGVDAIILDPIQPEALVNACKAAIAAGIPVIDCERQMLDPSAYTAIVTNSWTCGPQDVANFVVDYLKERFNGEVKGTIVEIQTDMGSTPQIARHNYFHDIVGAYPDVKIVGGASGNGDENQAYDIMSDYVSAYPDIDVVYCHSEAMVMGAYKALEAAGRNVDDIAFVGVDLSKEGATWIVDGKIDALACFTPNLFDVGIRVICKIFNEEPIPQTIWLDNQPLATAENVLEPEVCGGAYGQVPEGFEYIWTIGEIPGSVAKS